MEPQNRILQSKCKNFFQLPPDQTAAEYIIRKCATFPADHPCIENPISKEVIQYAEVEPFSRNVATFLLANGFAPGDAIINVSHDGANLHIFFMGVWRAGGIIQCFYPDDIKTGLVHLLQDSKAKFVLCDLKDTEDCSNAVNACSDKTFIKIITFGEANNTDCVSVRDIFDKCNGYEDLRSVNVRRQDVALLLPTSGTTGKSKSVIYTHETLLRNVILFENFPFTDNPSAATLLTGKQTHFTGSVCPLAFFAAGRYLLMMADVNQENILRVVENYKVRSIFSFPSYLTGLVEFPSSSVYNLQSLRFAFTAGMVVGSAFFITLRKLQLEKIVTIYGMTEAGFLAANVEWNGVDEDVRTISGTITINSNGGKLPPGASLHVRDIETGRFLGAGQKGELCFKNDLVCVGYWKNIEATRLTFEDGWISTGDLGYYDEEGNVYVLNRIKEVFKYYNNHITPSELENIILQHPAVEEACVIGIPDPLGGGTIPKAYVKLRSNQNAAEANEILLWANENVSDYKKLRGGLQILEFFPKGKSGKILRDVLPFTACPVVMASKFTTPVSD